MSHRPAKNTVTHQDIPEEPDPAIKRDHGDHHLRERRREQRARHPIWWKRSMMGPMMPTAKFPQKPIEVAAYLAIGASYFGQAITEKAAGLD
jgi:hypothetical protein